MDDDGWRWVSVDWVASDPATPPPTYLRRWVGAMVGHTSNERIEMENDSLRALWGGRPYGTMDYHHINLAELNVLGALAEILVFSPLARRPSSFCILPSGRNCPIIIYSSSYIRFHFFFVLFVCIFTASAAPCAHSCVLFNKNIIRTILINDVKTESTKETNESFVCKLKTDLNSLLVKKWHWTFGICVETEMMNETYFFFLSRIENVLNNLYCTLESLWRLFVHMHMRLCYIDDGRWWI